MKVKLATGPYIHLVQSIRANFVSQPGIDTAHAYCVKNLKRRSIIFCLNAVILSTVRDLIMQDIAGFLSQQSMTLSDFTHEQRLSVLLDATSLSQLTEK